MAEIPDDVLDLFRQQFAEMAERTRNLNSMLGGLSQSIQQVIRQTKDASGGSTTSATSIPQSAGTNRQEAAQVRVANVLGQMVSALNANTRAVEQNRQTVERTATRAGGIAGVAAAAGIGAVASGFVSPIGPNNRNISPIIRQTSRGNRVFQSEEEAAVFERRSEANKRGAVTRRENEEERRRAAENDIILHGKKMKQPWRRSGREGDPDREFGGPISQSGTTLEQVLLRQTNEAAQKKHSIDSRIPNVLPINMPEPVVRELAPPAMNQGELGGSMGRNKDVIAEMRRRADARRAREQEAKRLSVDPNVAGSQTIPGPTLSPTIPPANVPTPEPAPESGDETAAQLRQRARDMGVPDVKPNWTKDQARRAMARHQQSQQTAQPVTRPVPQVVDTPAPVPQPTEEPAETPRATPGRGQSRKVEKVPEVELPVKKSTPPIALPGTTVSHMTASWILRKLGHLSEGGVPIGGSSATMAQNLPEWPPAVEGPGARVLDLRKKAVDAFNVPISTPAPAPAPIPGQGWGIGTPFGGRGTPFGANPNVPIPVPTPTPTPPTPTPGPLNLGAFPWMGQPVLPSPIPGRGGPFGAGNIGMPGAPLNNPPMMGGNTGFSEGGGRDPWSLETTQQSVWKTLQSILNYTRQTAAGIANIKMAGGMQQQKEERDEKIRQTGGGMDQFSNQLAISSAIGIAAIGKLNSVADPSAWSTFTGQIRILSGVIGEVFTPYVLGAADAIQGWSDYMRTFNDETKNTIGRIAIATVGFLGYGAVVTRLIPAVLGLGGAIKGLAVFTMANPVTAALTGIALAVGAVTAGLWAMSGAAKDAAGEMKNAAGFKIEGGVPALHKDVGVGPVGPGGQRLLQQEFNIIKDENVRLKMLDRNVPKEERERVLNEHINAQQDLADKMKLNQQQGRQTIAANLPQQNKILLEEWDKFMDKAGELFRAGRGGEIGAARNQMIEAVRLRAEQEKVPLLEQQLDLMKEQIRAPENRPGQQTIRVPQVPSVLPSIPEDNKIRNILQSIEKMKELGTKIGAGEAEKLRDFVPPVKARYTDMAGYREAAQLALLNVPSTEVKLAEDQMRRLEERFGGVGDLMKSLEKLPDVLRKALLEASPFIR